MSRWVYPLGQCEDDSTKKCPYRYEHKFSWLGNFLGLKADTKSMVKCCRFKRMCESMERIQNESNSRR